MRLFLLPISTRRTLIYCERLHVTTTDQKTYFDKGIVKATNLWQNWEKKESGWQKKVVDYGNYALRRIPYEEWGLKSIPPISARKKPEELEGKGIVEVAFPEAWMSDDRAKEVLKILATERQSIHRKRLIWSVVGMPISAPFALVPIVPNLPFFYLVFRAYSHWKALSGSKHVEFLLGKDLIKPAPSKILDELYSKGNRPFHASTMHLSEEARTVDHKEKEQMILHKSDGKLIAEALNLPDVEIELDRAVWQVEQAIKADELREEEAAELRKANEKGTENSKETK